MPNWRMEKIYLDPKVDDMTEIALFLKGFNLDYEYDLEKTMLIKIDGRIAATGSISGNVLKCIAIDPSFQGEGMLNLVVTTLKDFLFEKGEAKSFVYTSENNVKQFQSLGFKEVERIEDYPVLLEDSLIGIESFQRSLKKELESKVREKFDTNTLADLDTASMVMNCNPITNGHLYLIKRAASENDLVIIFVVSEDRSLFPTEVRFNLIKQATSDLENVIVLKGEDYILSYSTFPTYFLGSANETKKRDLYARLDAKIFASYIANALKINRRYVGEEPYCSVTAQYNQVLQDILPSKGIEVKLIKRKEHQGEAISASKVREYIREGKWDKIKEIIPKATYDFLKSSEAVKVIDKIKGSSSRH